MNTNKLQKLLVALCIMVGACVFVPANSEVQAASSQSTQVHYEEMDIAPYRSGDVYTAPKPTEEGYEDWIFAGWFKEQNEDNAIASTTKTGTRWAKFVPAEVLSVKCQVADGTEAGQEGNSKMRIVSSIDSKRYNKVGFDIVVEGREKPIHYESASVAKSIVARNEGVDYNYSPNIFDLKSNYFITVTINNIPSDYFDNGFYIKPYWVTKDNTKVYGIERFARVEDYYLDIVNVPVRLYSDATVTSGTVEVDYALKLRKLTTDAAVVDAFTYLGFDTGSLFSQVGVTDNATDKTVICTLPENANATKADGMLVNLRFQKNTAEKNTLPKKNTFGVTANLKDTEGADVAVVTMNSVYQYHNTEYTGAVDTAWYMNKVAGQTEFVITTPDELYGLASLVNAGTFGTEKVYLASDITVNSSVLDSSGKLVANTSELTAWTPIGTSSKWDTVNTTFQGAFDGQGHTISGLYTDISSTSIDEMPTQWCVGLFGAVCTAKKIENIKVVNSYFKGNHYIGSIVGLLKTGTIKNCYSSSTVTNAKSSYTGVGGIAGGVGASAASTVKSVVKECWFDGSVDAIGWICGGIVGYVREVGCDIIDCLNTGSLSGVNNLGGIVGRNETATSITRSVSICKSIKDTDTSGMVIGRQNAGTLTVDNVHALVTDAVAAVGTGTVTNEITTFTDRATYTGYSALETMGNFEFNNTWVVRQSDTPVLKAWVESGALYTPSNDVWVSGQGETYTITTPEQLYKLAQDVNSGITYENTTFILGKDITINSGNSANWGTKAPKYNWIPIGNSSNPFKGHFNDTEELRAIKGLYTKQTGTNFVGLFGTVQNGSVKNIKVTNSYFSGAQWVGAISAYSVKSTINTTYSDATVIASNAKVGGIIGNLCGGTVSNSWFAGTVTHSAAKQHAGGIVGQISDVNGSVVDNCLVTGTITGGMTSGNAYAGGIVGGITGKTSNGTNTIRKATVTNCLSAAKSVTANGATSCVSSVIGGLNLANVTASNNYGLQGICNDVLVGSGGTNVTITNQPKVVSNIQGGNGSLLPLDFETYWVPIKNEVPALKSFIAENDENIVNLRAWYDGPEENRGDGSQEKPYIIQDEYELYALAQIVNTTSEDFKGKYIKLQDDLTFNTNTNFDEEGYEPVYTWTPIGTTANTFKGKFNATSDAEIHTIKGLYANGSDDAKSTWYVSLFGVAADAEIKNLKVIDSYFAGADYVSAIVSKAANTLIDSVYTNATVSATATAAAGIVGNSDSNSIHNCWFDGQVTGQRFSGGLVGIGQSTDIVHCLNTGDVLGRNYSGNAYIGGIVGIARGSFELKDSLSAARKMEQLGTSAKGLVIGASDQTGTQITIEHTYSQDGVELDVVGARSDNQYPCTLSKKLHTVSNIKGGNGSLLSLDFENYWVPIQNEVPALKSFVAENDENSVNLRAWYDGPAENRGDGSQDNPYVIQDEYELYVLAQIVNAEDDFEGKYIELQDDLTFNTDTDFDAKDYEPVYTWTPIGKYNTNPFKGTFAGQELENGEMYTISGLYSTTNTHGAGLFGYADGVTIRNFELMDSYFEATGKNGAGSVLGWSIGKVTLDSIHAKATVVGNAHCAGIAGVVNGAQSTITNCWFEGSVNASGNYVGGITSYLPADNVRIANCLVEGSVKGSQQVGGITGRTAANVVLENCLSVADITASSSKGALVGLHVDKELTFNTCFGVKSGVTVAVNTSATTYTDDAKTEIKTQATGNATDADVKAKALLANKESLYDLGAFGTQVYSAAVKDDDGNVTTPATNVWVERLDYNNWTARIGDVPVPNVFAETDDYQIDTSWYTDTTADGSATNPYMIENVADFYGLALLSQTKTFSGKTISLANNIVINTDDTTKENAKLYEWLPIGDKKTAFAGTFEGNGHTISGLYRKWKTGEKLSWIGMFENTADGSVVRNFNIKNTYFVYANTSDITRVGSVAGEGYGKFDSIYSDATLVSGGCGTGGIIGQIGDNGTLVDVSNCWFAGNITGTNTTGSSYAGGIIGVAQTSQDINISHCLVTGDVIAREKRAGGLIGSLIDTVGEGVKDITGKPVDGNASTVTLSDNLITGKVTALSTDDGDDSQYAGIAIGAVEHKTLHELITVNISSTFGINDYAPSGIDYESSMTYEESTLIKTTKTEKNHINGFVYSSPKTNRFIGYAGATDTNGNYIGLDFAGNSISDNSGFSGWSFIKGGTPVLTYFVGNTDEGKIVSSEIVRDYNETVAEIDSLLKLDYWESAKSVSYSSAEDKGSGNYVITLPGISYSSEAGISYTGYINALTADDSIFTAYENDNDKALNDEGVYNAILTSKIKGDDLNKDWVVIMTYVEGSTKGVGTVYISVSMGQPLSTHLKASDVATTDYQAADGYTAETPQKVKFHMLEENYYSASSYVIQLSNGHFIIIDGGVDGESDELFAYLKSLIPEEADGTQKKPIVEAWIISHGHVDHCGLLQTVFRHSQLYKNSIKDENGNIRGREYEKEIYVEGIYFNEPSAYVTRTYDDGHYPFVGGIKDAARLFNTTGGGHPQIYRMQTGQRYTFDTVKMDILLAQELLTMEEYASTASEPGDAFNETSTWTLFTFDEGKSNEKTLLTAGDGSEASKNKIVAMYGDTEFMTVNVFTALHHGTNLNRLKGNGYSPATENDTFSNALTVKDVVLFANRYDFSIENTAVSESKDGKVPAVVAQRVNLFLNKMTELGQNINVEYDPGATSKEDNRYFYYGQGTCVLTFGSDKISVRVLSKIYNLPVATTTETE